ncbi:hypothetical protein [Nostoc sp.]|uniref:hypothetical protein n=1 Tax=Nostoc sp. TaxID=1180 RepID=UPI002FFCAA6C
MGHWALGIDAVCDFLSDLTPNPFPTSVGEQESKPIDLSGRGMEVGFQELSRTSRELGIGNWELRKEFL